jgi:O-antigen/teichoic acid export membrane protein
LDDPVTLEIPGSNVAAGGQPRSRRVASRLLGLIPGLRGTFVSDRLMVAVRGSAWTSAGYGASQLLKVTSTLILARLLLDPKAFGLMALVNVFLTGLEVLSDLGIGLDIVQHPRGDDPDFLDTAFVIQIGRSVLLCLLAVGLTVPFASFYHQPEVRWLAMIGSLSVGIRGFASMSVWSMTRRVQLGKLATLNVISDAIGAVVAIVWAIMSPSAWALVAGKVAAALAYVIVTHVFSQGLPRFRFERQAARDILIFGSGIFLSSATYFFSTQSERLVVGKFATVAELGCFSLALSIAYAPYGIVQRVITTVFFPMIADTARQDAAKVAVHLRKFRTVFLTASLVMCVGFITLSHWVVAHVLRPQYSATAWMLQLLGFRAALELFGSAASALLLAVGLSRANAVGHAIKTVFLGAGLAIAFGFFGLKEAMWVLAVSPCIHYFAILHPLHKRFKFVLRTEMVCFTIFLATAALTALAYHATVAK